MAIAVNLYYTGSEGNARKFAQEMVSNGTVAKFRAEDGNLRYEYFFPMDDTETVLLNDAWKDQAALDVHHASPMMEKISELREKYNLHMKVERYLFDEEGIPDQDTQFMRK
ncbi:MAG: antibiotic biosynthesis monooxygenase [Clostridiales bacterium]|nr:antibiotic biosynthesis monooxygenase [Clostridiales bacterium]